MDTASFCERQARSYEQRTSTVLVAGTRACATHPGLLAAMVRAVLDVTPLTE